MNDNSSVNPPVFSIVIPAYMAAQYLGEAIQSVLNQTFPDFEIIVVNDASPDDTTSVMMGFNDPRIKYIIHPENRGLPATRNTAIRASTGKYVALLDADDVFHPDKLQEHYNYLIKHPDIGVSYNSRFDVLETTENICRVWIAPREIKFGDFVLGYPFSPSDIVIQRDWLFTIGLLHEYNNIYGEDLNTNCRLALAGCKFGYVERVLNYRRHYRSRIRKNLDESLLEVFRNLDLVFTDSRCPYEVLELRDRAYAYNYSVWAYWAFAQGETELGRKFLRQAIHHDHQLMVDNASSLLNFLIMSCVVDERGDLAEAMNKIFSQIPEEFSDLHSQYKWALGRALLVKGFEDLMWGRDADGQELIERALQVDAKIADSFIGLVVHQLLGYEIEFGEDKTLLVVGKLKPYLNKVSKRSGGKLEASFLVNQAFQNYRNGKYNNVSRNVLQAWMHDPLYLTNRGVVSILFRSIIRMLQ